MKHESKIDIPFGAKDSELKGWEYTIPEGMEAEIKDGKVIVREKENYGERIRKALCDIVRDMPYMETELRAHGLTVEKTLTYLEKQKEEEVYEAIPLESTPEYKLGFNAGKESEKQKEPKPVISNEAIREGIAHFGITQYQIDNWLKKHINVVEQKSTEKLSKEEYVKKFKALCDAYEIKLSNREYDIYHLCDDLSKLSIDSGKQKPTEYDKETETQKAFREGQNAGRQEVFDNPWAYGLEKIDNVFGFRIGDKVRLVDGDGKQHIIKMFEKIEGLHGQDFYRVVFEDNTASCHIFEYPNGYIARIEKVDEQKEQKPVELSDEELQRHMDELYDFKVFAAKQAKEHHISFVHDFEWHNFCAGLLSYFNKKHEPAEWSEEDEKIRQSIIKDIEFERNYTLATTDKANKVIEKYNKQIAWLKSHRLKKSISYGELPLVSIDYMEGLDTYFEKQVGAVIASAMNREHQFTSKYIKWMAQWLMECAKNKQNSEEEHVSDNKEWSEEDDQVIGFIFDLLNVLVWRKDWAMSKEECLERLKSLRPPFKDREMKLKILKYLSTRCSSLEFEEVEDYLNNLRPSWKPSEEQMEALNKVVNGEVLLTIQHKSLESLYNDLLKIINYE